MPLHPAAPEDLPGLVAAYGQTVRAVIDLGRSCTPRDFDKETACPGWSVKDQISHVTGVEQWLSGAPLPRVQLPDYGHVQSDFDRVTESMVEMRRRMLGTKVVDELEGVLAKRLAQLGAPELTLETPVKGPIGVAPAGEVLRMRILDIWTHEQDIREALGRPGDLDAPGAAVFLDALCAAMPRLVAKNAGIEPGNVVIFDITGPVVGPSAPRSSRGRCTSTPRTPRSPASSCRPRPSPAGPPVAVASTTSTSRSRATRPSAAGSSRHCPSPSDRGGRPPQPDGPSEKLFAPRKHRVVVVSRKQLLSLEGPPCPSPSRPPRT
jgi:uncharacterized protein (TIGR03083 family)